MTRHKLLLLLLMATLPCGSLQAQSAFFRNLTTSRPGEGTVTIHQDASITALIGSSLTPGASGSGSQTGVQEIKRTGFRVLVYAGSNTHKSKTEAYDIARRVREDFPDLSVYTMFQPPRWLCKVGDFTNIEEADALMRKLRKSGGFKEVTIVKDQVTVIY